MAARVFVNRKPSGSALAMVIAPIALVVLAGAIIPRLSSQSRPQVGQIDWKAMNGYELSVARKYPHLRRGYESILARDKVQLAAIDHRLSSTSDPETRKGLEQQRLMVTSGINVVQQILDHFPNKQQVANGAM